MEAILISFDSDWANIEEVINHLKTNLSLFWEVPFDIIKERFRFPIKCYMHVSGTSETRYVGIAEDIIPHKKEHYLGENATRIKVTKWIDDFKQNPPDDNYFKYSLVFSKLEKLTPPFNTLSIKKIDGTLIKIPPQGYVKIIDPIEDSSPSNERDYWIYAPGENARLWNEFYGLGIMGIGWDKLGNLNNYHTKEQIAIRLGELAGNETARTNDALTCFNFVHSLKKGDIVIPKQGRIKYLGFGIVESEYLYDDSRKEYKNIRKVNWIKKGEWLEDSGNIVLKALTKISQYVDYVNKLKRLIGIEFGLDHNSLEKLIQKASSLNFVLYGPPGTGKTYNTKRRAVDIIEGRNGNT